MMLLLLYDMVGILPGSLNIAFVVQSFLLSIPLHMPQVHGFPSIRHNEIRDLTANLLESPTGEVCGNEVGEQFALASSNTEDGARLDISANQWFFSGVVGVKRLLLMPESFQSSCSK